MRPDRPSSAEKTHSPFVCTVSPTIDRNWLAAFGESGTPRRGNELFPASRPSEKLNVCSMIGLFFHRSERGNRCKYAALPEIHMACRTIATEQD
jgi:hypothetical protein